MKVMRRFRFGCRPGVVRRTASGISLGEFWDTRLFPVTLTISSFPETLARMAETASGNNATTRRVRQHRERAGLIRVEVEVPTPDDALAVRRFAQARRRAKETPAPAAPSPPAATADTGTILAAMDIDRQEIVLLFAQALAQTTAPDLLARGRRVALNFAEAVAQGRRDMALRDHDGPQ